MAKPKPVPPYSRVVDPSAWVNRSKTAVSFSDGIPIPVSETAKRNVPGRLAPLSFVTRTVTSPRSVNLMAFPTKFTRTCRRRWGSPIRPMGTSDAVETSSSSPFACALSAMSSVTLSSTSPRSNRICSSAMCPDSTFARSRMSLIKSRRLVLDLRKMPSSSCCSGDSDPSESRSDMPMMAFMGVRIS